MVAKMKQKNESEYYILQLLITDIFYILTMPFWIYSAFTEFFWPFGVIVCKFASGLFYLGMYGMTFFIAALSLNRYIILFTSSKMQIGMKKVLSAKKISIIIWVRILAAGQIDENICDKRMVCQLHWSIFAVRRLSLKFDT